MQEDDALSTSDSSTQIADCYASPRLSSREWGKRNELCAQGIHVTPIITDGAIRAQHVRSVLPDKAPSLLEANALSISCTGIALSQICEIVPALQGIHVAHIIVDGPIDAPRYRSMLPDKALISPDAIAETYWQLHRQDKSAWTQELDLRTSDENF